jgi:peptidyl-tRNA hydrolase
MAQLCHASGETGPAKPGTHAIILSAADERELLSIADRLRKRDIDFHLIHEPDAPYLGAATAIGLSPGPRQRALGHLRLYEGQRTKS